MFTRHFSHPALASISCAVFVASLLATVPAQAQTPTTIYTFTPPPGPLNPNVTAITQGRDGNLYLTAQGGSGNAGDCSTTYCGEAFSISPAGVVTDLYDFSNQGCSGQPFICGFGAYGGLTLGTDGNFYGAFFPNDNGFYGAVFKLTPTGVPTALHSFTNTGDGGNPYAAPIQGTNGTFYGTTTSANVASSTAYSVTRSGVFKTLHTFTSAEGQNIYYPLVQGTDGNFYGIASAGGTNNNGTIFKMTAAGKLTVLHQFTGTDGSFPVAIISGADGNFYGATNTGGSVGAGVIFKITSGGTFTVVHNLNGTTDGTAPNYSLIQATDGKLYGVTNPPDLTGTIYSVTTSGTFTTLYTFTGGTDGGFPTTALRQHTNGLLYGGTYIGGDINGCSTNVNGQIHLGCGVFYSLDLGLSPFAYLMTTSGKELSSVEILGQGFTKSSTVEFGGVAATKITVTGSTYILATIPAGALTGAVTVTTSGTTLTSSHTFSVLPTIASFSPSSGPVGTAVQITGTGLMQTTSVSFGGVKATSITVNSDSQVIANVPTGAKTGKVGVTTKGGKASSKTIFSVT